MITKEQKYGVWGFNAPIKCEVYVEDGKVKFYAKKEFDDSLHVRTYVDDAVFFDTENEAIDYLDKRFEMMFSNIDSIENFLVFLQRNSETENEAIKKIRKRFSRFLDSGKDDMCDDYYRLSRDLSLASRGLICINGFTFCVSDVKYIRWGKSHAELHLKDDKQVICTRNFNEFTTVDSIFGHNTSEIIYDDVDKII